MDKPRIFAFYLPQFYPTDTNNKWYGNGFTEWTNVVKAKKLFLGHKQPHIPADLGFYDLRLQQTRLDQAQLAQKYEIEGFCYYHYWFAPGITELDLPLNEVIKSGQPDYPFMLCWANESWQKKFWNIDGTINKNNIFIQTYGGADDYKKHFYDILNILKDKRYIKIDDRPAFMIYKPLSIPDLHEFITLWDNLAKENGLKGIFFIGQSIYTEKEKEVMINQGINAINSVRHYERFSQSFILKRKLIQLLRLIFRLPLIQDYRKIYKTFLKSYDLDNDVFPTIIPNWDHTPRSGKGGYVITNSSPSYFKKHVKQVLNALKRKKKSRQIAFIKSWNEWGEGNYLEPDLQYGTQYLEVLKDEISKY